MPLTSPRFPQSYGCNAVDAGSIGGSSPMPYGGGVNIAAMSDSARTILITENAVIYDEMVTSNVDWLFAGHLGTVNFLFADGHVKALKPLSTATPTNMWNIEETNDAFPTLVTQMSAWSNKVNK